MPWRWVDHTADVGLRIEAPTLAALFEEAAEALVALLVEEPETVEPRETLEFALEADDPADLLFDWLQTLLVTFELRGLLLTGFRVDLEGRHLRAAATGEPVDPARHRLAHEVKAIAYHGLSLRATDDGWLAEVVVDI
ncbi:MAG: archease [bacterium]|nr:archease [bacterium]